MLGDRLGQPLLVWHLFSYELLLCALKYSINRPNESQPQNCYLSKNPIKRTSETPWHRVVNVLNQGKQNTKQYCGVIFRVGKQSVSSARGNLLL